MVLIGFLKDTPVVALLLLLVLLITVVPVIGSIRSRRKRDQRPVKEPPVSRFQGIRMDIWILVLGLLLLLGGIAWLYRGR